MKTKNPWPQRRRAALLAALGMGAAMTLPAQAQSPPAPGSMYSEQPLTSTHQPELRNWPSGTSGPSPADESRSRDAQGMGTQGGAQPQGGMGGPYSRQPATSTHQPELRTWPGGAQRPQEGLTREEVRAETEAWREAGLLELMDAEDSSVWLDPEVQRLRREVDTQVEARRAMNQPPELGTRDAGGMGQDGSR